MNITNLYAYLIVGNSSKCLDLKRHFVLDSKLGVPHMRCNPGHNSRNAPNRPFRVHVCLLFKGSPSAKFFLRKLVCIHV